MIKTKVSIPSAIRTPKAKSLPKPGDKMSLFLKSETAVHPSIRKVLDFLNKKHLG